MGHERMTWLAADVARITVVSMKVMKSELGSEYWQHIVDVDVLEAVTSFISHYNFENSNRVLITISRRSETKISAVSFRCEIVWILCEQCRCISICERQGGNFLETEALYFIMSGVASLLHCLWSTLLTILTQFSDPHFPSCLFSWCLFLSMACGSLWTWAFGTEARCQARPVCQNVCHSIIQRVQWPHSYEISWERKKSGVVGLSHC